ncbi:shikimate dehydrogenase [Rhodococcus oxybenzonivorans]|uniref:shikimate dehydrogenase n=1 Tax=Rhodococcus oxybenzonivorans TaxID=1990687 RepID=UPI002954ECD9|nr:shikimate dehydrogenase [Rhodococcus oxybenzonivorans]MDV7357057.1 shikimate dehydrogenase [Rhodococcus oxybenzonivorans]
MISPDLDTVAVSRPSYLCGLIGSGISKSLTPPLHEAEGQAQGVGYVYRILDLDTLALGEDALPRLLASAKLLGFDGLNITHPCKQAVIPLLDDLSDDARTLGAVNTVHIANGRLIGHNTDWSGFARNMDEGLGGAPTDRVVQLGAGGAGAAVAYAALTRGVLHFTIIDADVTRAQLLRDSLAAMFPDRVVVSGDLSAVPAAIGQAQGLINATPLGMAQHPGMALDAELLRPDLWVADVVYRPAETELLRRARDIGARTLSGIGMAVGQAVDSFRIFTGLEPDALRMQEHMRRLLAEEDSAALAASPS